MSTNENDLRSYGPGKFTLVIDELIYSMSLDGYNAEELGESEGFGYYALVSCDVAGITTSHLRDWNREDITHAEWEFLASHPWAILSEDSQGSVSVDYYETEAAAREAWAAIEAKYEAWCEDNA